MPSLKISYSTDPPLAILSDKSNYFDNIYTNEHTYITFSISPRQLLKQLEHFITLVFP